MDSGSDQSASSESEKEQERVVVTRRKIKKKSKTAIAAQRAARQKRGEAKQKESSPEALWLEWSRWMKRLFEKFSRLDNGADSVAVSLLQGNQSSTLS